MATDTADLRRLAFNLFSLVATPVALYYAASWLFETLDPLKSRNDAAKKQSARTVQRLQKSLKDANIRLKDITEHETVIMSEVITPDELNVKFDGILIHTTKLTRTDIGGLEDIISSVKETVIYPLVYPDLFQSASYFLFEICLMLGACWPHHGVYYCTDRPGVAKLCSLKQWLQNRTSTGYTANIRSLVVLLLSIFT